MARLSTARIMNPHVSGRERLPLAVTEEQKTEQFVLYLTESEMTKMRFVSQPRKWVRAYAKAPFYRETVRKCKTLHHVARNGAGCGFRLNYAP